MFNFDLPDFDLPVDYDSLSTEERRFVRNKYSHLQNGDCYFCGHSLNDKPDEVMNKYGIDLGLFPPNMLKTPVHLHYNHASGMTIGAVHAYCNCVLWQHYNE